MMETEIKVKSVEDIAREILLETATPEQADAYVAMINRADPKDMELHELFVRSAYEKIEKLERLSVVDPLTELYNLRKFEVDLALNSSKAERLEDVLGLTFVDVDYLKQINDGHKKHRKGDIALRNVAKCMDSALRDYDMMTAYRIGGDEFALLFYGIDAKGAGEATERLRLDFERTGATLSAGVSSFKKPSTSVQGLRDDADKKLYEAKEQRNIVVVYKQVA